MENFAIDQQNVITPKELWEKSCAMKRLDNKVAERKDLTSLLSAYYVPTAVLDILPTQVHLLFTTLCSKNYPIW